jgi:hypothetical protein
LGVIVPKIPRFIFDILVTRPSISGPAMSVPRTEATKDDKLVAPTATTEKLYGGAEKICESVREMPTSHEIHVVNSNTAHRTAGEAKR